MHVLEEKIRQAQQAGRMALIPFLTFGFPDQAHFWPTLMELDSAGADIIEIGVPFSDPVADGPVVEACSRSALSEGVTLQGLIKELAKRKGLLHAGLVLMGYYNPFLQYGLERLANDCSQAGVHGFIVPDLPLEESAPMREALNAYDLALIPLVGPNTTEERMRLYAEKSKGYCYVVSVLGVTGARKSLPLELCDTIARARKVFQIPLALGFGLKEPSQLNSLSKEQKPDACVFGSALLTHIQEGKSAADFIQKWR